jgi:hypothetical protein
MPFLQRPARQLDQTQRRQAIDMFSSKIIRPVNSLLFVSDPAGGVVPEWIQGTLVLATPSCISVSCHPEQDGPTEVILGKARDVDPGDHPVFDGELETPGRIVVISTVERKTVLETRVPDTHTRVRIWLNHPRWPDKVIVGLE